MIKVENLHKSYDNHKVIKGMSFDVNKGEVLAVIGPSGTGKSTMLRCLNYLEQAEEGILTINDLTVDFANISKEEIKKIRMQSSMVFQNYNLFANKTVLENVTEALIVVKKMSKKEAIKKAEGHLKEVNMWDKKDQYPSRLSGGQQQRVGIARAMAVNPEVILFDEPTSSLDPALVNEVLDTIKKLADANVTMIIVTHEMKFAKNVADQVMFLSDGVICEKGSPDEIFNHPQNEKTKSFLEAAAKY